MTAAPTPVPSRPRLGRLGRLALGLLVSGAFIALAIYALRDVTLDAVLARLAAGNYGLVGVYVGLLFVLSGLRVVRWGALVRGIGPVPWRKIASVSLIGQMAIGLLPMRLGEAVRPLLIVDPGRVNFGEATATVVVERIVDGILLGLLLASTLWALGDRPLPPEFRVGAYATTALFGSLALFLLVGSIFHYRVLRLVRAVVGPFAPRLADKLVGLVESFLLALRTIVRARRQAALFFVATLSIWLLTGLSLLPIFAAFGIDLSIVASFTVICVMVVGYMIPAGPAATGTLNYAIVVALTAFGVERSLTGALAILLYVLILVVNVIVGLAGLWLGHRRLATILTADLPAVPDVSDAAPSPPDPEPEPDAPRL